MDNEEDPQHSQGPAPAPLDLGRLEVEAKQAAAKLVASLLQRPDQLDKVDQYKRRVARKKASVEAMLKTAVQSQLDGVRTGLNQLQSALQDVYQMKQSLDEIEENYRIIEPLHKSLQGLKDENHKFCQLAAAQENLKHIFTVPETVVKTRELIMEGKLLQAHKFLTDLEMSRDDLLLALHKQPNQSPTDKNTLSHYFSEVQDLTKDLGKQLWVIIQRTLMSVRREPNLICTALRIIEREERMDAAWTRKYEQTGFMPPGRPKRWRDKCFEVLQTSIAARIEGSQLETRDQNKMWLVRHLEITRQLMIDDLKVVKTLLPPVFPPEYDVVKRYTKMYHRALAAHLEEMIHHELEGNEIVSLLQWVGAYDSPELMRHPELKIDVKELGPLLENNLITYLRNQYLRNMKQNITEWSRNTLRSDLKDWMKGEAPDQDGDGFYNTQLPVIIFQMMEQNLQVANIIGQDLVKKVLGLFAEELNRFAQEYRAELQLFDDRHQEDRHIPQYFVHYMIANANNCLAFGEYMKELRKRYIKNEFEEEAEVDEDGEEGGQIRRDPFQKLTDHFLILAKFCCDVILEEVFRDLRENKCLNELFTRAWMSHSNGVETIIATWDDYHKDFLHLKPTMFEILLSKGQDRIVQEYVKALLSRKLSFKNYEERKISAEKICAEAEQMKLQFQEMSSKLDVSKFDVLPAMAEGLKLKDSSMLSLEIMGFAQKYPDIRMEQLVNFILCRGDISRSDARQLAIDTLGEDDPNVPKPTGIFTEIALSG
ncbi:exocyst complex component 3-like [Plakobranchus ocellatus]|uniref:Exocyst complex component 3-like n=1 Tax=Plakobranchus ocellatus TaxID=259542 RepID=A0AAV3ZD37_9GAST|nr:exocyst complex component 3-like [Plakobranchus ocellatus]